MTRRGMLASQLRKTKTQWTKAKFKRSSITYLDKTINDRLCQEVPSYKFIIPSVVPERLKIHGSLSRAAIQELLSKGHIKLVSKHRAKVIYVRNTKGREAPASGDDTWTTSTTRNTFGKQTILNNEGCNWTTSFNNSRHLPRYTSSVAIKCTQTNL